MAETTVVPMGVARFDFVTVFNRLAKAKRAKDIDSVDMDVYLAVLGNFPLWAIEEAANELMRTPTYGFPTTDVWVQQVEAEIARRSRESLSKRREWKDECTACHDSGWVEHVCDAAHRCGRFFCSQLGEKHEHTYYSACPCREHNSTYRRNTLASQLGHGEKDGKK